MPRSGAPPPDAWMIVENGSSDETRHVAAEFAARTGDGRAPCEAHPSSGHCMRASRRLTHARGRRQRRRVRCRSRRTCSRSVRTGFAGIPGWHCATLEEVDGVWQQRFVTGSTVWGATRPRRSRCLRESLPRRTFQLSFGESRAVLTTRFVSTCATNSTAQPCPTGAGGRVEARDPGCAEVGPFRGSVGRESYK